MTVKELINILEDFDEHMEVKIGMIQNYGSNFAMNIDDVEIHEVNVWNSWDSEKHDMLVITQGREIGTINYNEEEF